MRVAPAPTQSRLIKAFVLFVAATMLWCAPKPVSAEDWPKRPVTLVLAFASGGLIDFVGRALANEVSEAIGQPVVIDIKPGGGGVIATAFVAKAPADGYTLLMTAVGPAVLRPLMDNTVTYDTAADFTAISVLGESPNVLVANPKLGLNTVKDLIDYAKKNNGKISIGHSGPGTMGHLCSVLFATDAHLDASFISYRGAATLMTDVIGGQIDSGFPAYGPPVRSAKVLAVTTDERVNFLPDVPTMKESGYDVVGSTWFGIFGPAHMPPEVVAKLNDAIDTFLRKPETQQRFSEVGFRVIGGPPTRLSDVVAQDRARWSKIIARLNLGADK